MKERSANLRTSRGPGNLQRALRLGAYFSLLSLLAGFLVGRRASAELSERTLAFGRSLDAFQEFAGRVTRLSWNGQELAFSTLVVRRPVTQVLDRFVELCARERGSVADELARATGLRREAASLLERVMVIRELFTDGSGTGVCLAGLGEGGLAGLSARMRSFRRSHDLAELGQLRFARLRTTEDGDTHVLLVTADGPLLMDALVPRADRDAFGDDALAGVRPARSVRLASARAHGTPHTFTAYQTSQSAPDALADYGAQLRARGFELAAHPGGNPEPLIHAQGDTSILTEAYRRGPEAFVITARPDERGSVLSVVQLGALPIPPPGDAAEVGRAQVGRGELGGPRDPAY